jgi:hypothetical protein
MQGMYCCVRLRIQRASAMMCGAHSMELCFSSACGECALTVPVLRTPSSSACGRIISESYDENGEVRSVMTLANAEAEALLDLVARTERECDDLKVSCR